MLALSQLNLMRSWWGRWGEYLKPSHVIGPKALAKMAEPGSPLKPWCFKSQLTLHGAWHLLQSLCFQPFTFVTAWKAGLWRNRRTVKGFLWILGMSVVWLLLQYVMNLWKYSFFKIFSKSSDQIRSAAQSCPTLCDPMNRSTTALPVHHQLPEFTETHVHRVSDAIQPSHPLSSLSAPAPNPSQHQSLFQWVNSLHEVAKVLEFQL